MPADRLQITRDCYEAYATNDRARIEQHLAEDLTFFSPPDPGIDLAAYWDRCWPNAHTDGFDFVRLAEVGDDVLVTYEATRKDGSKFRNTEIMGFRGDEVVRIEVYFGWDL
jgi:ketosteroid isomerase-like protein